MAIDEVVHSLAKAFVARWKKALDTVAPFSLDFNWPSLATLDYCTFVLRGTRELNKDGYALLRGAASYVALYIEEMWSVNDAVQVSIRDDASRGIVLDAVFHFSDREPVVVLVPVQEVLASFLEQPDTPIAPVCGKADIATIGNEVLVSRLFEGVVLGRSAYIEGGLAEINSPEMTLFIESVNKSRASQCAVYYQLQFPDEPLGQVAELYLDTFFYPEQDEKEAFRLEHALTGLFAFCAQYGVSSAQLQRLAKNFCAIPDVEMATVGFVVATALLEGEPDAWLVARSESLGSEIPSLRRALQFAREKLCGADDWLYAESFHADHAAAFTAEKELGFMPLLTLSFHWIAGHWKKQSSRDLVQAILSGDSKRASWLVEQAIEKDFSQIELRLQRGFLFAVEGELDEASRMYGGLLTEPGCEKYSRLFYYWGNNDLLRGDAESAKRRLERVLASADLNPSEAAQARYNYTVALEGTGNVIEAEKLLSELSTNRIVGRAARLNRITVLQTLGRGEQCPAVLKSLYFDSPFHRDVFFRLISDNLTDII